MKAPARIRCACYRRVSTDLQNLDVQTRAMEAYCAARNWEPWWFDEVEGGSVNSRSVFLSVVRAAFDNEAQAVLFWSLDRMGRDQPFMLAQIQALEAHGTIVASTAEAWLEGDDDNKPVMLGVSTGMAASERRRLRRRVHAGLGAAFDGRTGKVVSVTRDEQGRRVSAKKKRLGRPAKPLSLLLEAKRLVVSQQCSIRQAAARVSVGLPKKPETPGGLCAISEGTLRKFLKGTWTGDGAEFGPVPPSPQASRPAAPEAQPDASPVRQKSRPVSPNPAHVIPHT